MGAEVCPFLMGKRNMFDINGLSLDFMRDETRDKRPISIDMKFVLPGHTYYDSWNQWMDRMERPSVACLCVWNNDSEDMQSQHIEDSLFSKYRLIFPALSLLVGL